MFPQDFFKPEDRQVKDKCPVCQHTFGKSYIKLERIYYCDECMWVLEFHPFEEQPRFVKLKKDSNMPKDYVPYEEDLWMIRKAQEEIEQPPEEEEPPSPDGPRKPPWWF